jgi:hypothetical protein
MPSILLRLLPVVLALLLLAAHFLRAGSIVLVMACLGTLVLLAWRRPWVPMVVQLVLALATVEWLITLVVGVEARMAAGVPWLRMALIIGVVALFTALSIVPLRSRALRQWYGS